MRVSPSLISLMVSVDVKHRVYLLTYLLRFFSFFLLFLFLQKVGEEAQRERECVCVCV